MQPTADLLAERPLSDFQPLGAVPIRGRLQPLHVHTLAKGAVV